MRRKIILTGIIRFQNQYLVVQRSKSDDFLPGVWEFPGGNIEYGELIVDALTILPDIHREFRRLVNSNFEITSSFSNEIAEQRIWEIEEFAKVPCGGTHIKRTGEIGEIILKRKNGGKGKERIEIYLES